MSYRRHTPINHEKRTPLEGVLSVSQDRISRQVREPFFPTQPKRTMGRGLARGGERLRCHRPLSLSRFPIRVSTINKFVLHSPVSPAPTLFILFIYFAAGHTTLEKESSLSSWQSWCALLSPVSFYYYCYYCFIAGGAPV